MFVILSEFHINEIETMFILIIKHYLHLDKHWGQEFKLCWNKDYWKQCKI